MEHQFGNGDEATLPADSPRTDAVLIYPHLQGEEKKLHQIPHSTGKKTSVSKIELEGKTWSSSTLLPDPTMSNLSGGGRSSMHNDGSSRQVNGLAREDGDIKIGLGHILQKLNAPSAPDVITSEPSLADLSVSNSPPAVESSRQLQLLELHEKKQDYPSFEHSFDRDHSEPNRVLNSNIEIGGTPLSDCVQGGPTPVLQGDSSSHGFAYDSNIETGGTPSLDRVQGVPPLVLQGDFSSHGFTHEETEGTHSSDPVPGEPGFEDFCSYHQAREDNWQRLTTMVDPSIGVIVQSACSLVAYKESDGFSPAEDMLAYVLVFIYVVGFLFTLGGKWYRCSKMGVLGLVAAALGFLLTMALVVIYKIG